MTSRGGRRPRREGGGLHSSRAAPSFRSAHHLPGILIDAQAEGLLSPNSADIPLSELDVEGNQITFSNPDEIIKSRSWVVSLHIYDYHLRSAIDSRKLKGLSLNIRA